ncbi:MAG: MarR family transcriptional regulator [Gaiellales bacterium]
MPNRQLFLKAGTVSTYVERIVEQQLVGLDLPPYLLGLLTHVGAHAPVTPSTISVASGVPATTLRDNIQRLVDRGLIRRIPNPVDGRSYLVEPTAKGKRVLAKADPALLEAYLALERRLSRPLVEYEALLDELAAALAAGIEAGAVPAPTRDHARQ